MTEAVESIAQSSAEAMLRWCDCPLVVCLPTAGQYWTEKSYPSLANELIFRFFLLKYQILAGTGNVPTNAVALPASCRSRILVSRIAADRFSRIMNPRCAASVNSQITLTDIPFKRTSSPSVSTPIGVLRPCEIRVPTCSFLRNRDHNVSLLQRCFPVSANSIATIGRHHFV